MTARCSGLVPSGSARSTSAPAFYQRLHGVGVTRTDRERERREPGVGTGVDVRPLRHQRRYDRRVPLRSGPHQRGLPAPSFPRVDGGGGAVSEQRGHAVDDAGPRGHHQRRLALRRCALGVSSGTQQGLHHSRMPAGGGKGQRRHPVAGRGVDFPAGFEQQLDRRRIPLVGCPVQRHCIVRNLPRDGLTQPERHHDGSRDAPDAHDRRDLNIAVHYSPPDHQFPMRV